MGAIAFTGDLDPDLSAAAVALRRAGFELTMMPEKFRSYLTHPDDYFMEASIAGTQDDKSISAIMNQINAIVDRYKGYCWECGPILSDHVPFEGLFDSREVKPRDH
jgi:hypothetical protein